LWSGTEDNSRQDKIINIEPGILCPEGLHIGREYVLNMQTHWPLLEARNVAGEGHRI
jgi:hypothetical protein